MGEILSNFRLDSTGKSWSMLLRITLFCSRFRIGSLVIDNLLAIGLTLFVLQVIIVDCVITYLPAELAELVDALDSGSSGSFIPCEFKSRVPHLPGKNYLPCLKPFDENGKVDGGKDAHKFTKSTGQGDS